VITAAIDSFLPPCIRDGDADILRRSRLVVALGGTLSILAIVYAVLFLLMDSPISAAVLATGTGVAAASLCITRRGGSCLVVGNLLAADFFATMTALACRLGGHGSHGLAWFAGVSVVALSTAGRRSALFWLVMTAIWPWRPMPVEVVRATPTNDPMT
jgi:hypothetical protein